MEIAAVVIQLIGGLQPVAAIVTRASSGIARGADGPTPCGVEWKGCWEGWVDPVVFTLAVLTASVIAGGLGALLGIGGGMILIPFLTIFLHVNMRLAIGASIVSVIATSSGAAAAYLKDRITNVRVGMFLEIATTTGALAGAFLAAYLSPAVLSLIFGVVLAYSAAMMFKHRHSEAIAPEASSPVAMRLRLAGTYHDMVLDRQVDYGVTGVAPGLGIMWIAGALSGLLGIGSGAFKVLAMDLAMKLPMKVSSTTSNLMIGVTAATSAGVYFFRGDINPYLTAPVALGVLLGTQVGTRVLVRLSGSRLKQVFVLLLVFLAIQMIWKGAGGVFFHGHG